ncbi:hypothetical protein GDO86_001604 [Hymenochirus boettgeri]|uniref:Ig-like domain-containing protein n=1 Tax=Hymenochirus boettgeri TaxID=247094 RepID=A0A8T2KGJ7_9PIPI|nr:hypothetical protein GDO86_001604 [Hymenochirus boettgeri]
MALFYSGSSADIILTQKPSETAKVDSSIQLQCVVTGYNINDHHMYWMRQVPGEGKLEWLAAFRTGQTTYINEGFKNRVTPSTSGSTAQLKIDRLTKSDAAVYYCARHRSKADNPPPKPLFSSITPSPLPPSPITSLFQSQPQKLKIRQPFIMEV